MGAISRRDALRAGVVSTAVVGGVAAGASVVPGAAQAADTGEGWLSVLDYGAVGNGTTNDTAAIQAAFNAAAATTPGKGVYFPAGRVFKVSDQLNVNGLTDAVISGYGATIALAGPAPVERGQKAVLRLRNCQRVKLLGLTVRDTDRSQQFTGVWISSSIAIVVDGVGVYNVRFNGIGVYDEPARGSEDITITNCTTEGTYFGISSNGKDVRIVNNHVAMDWPSTDEAAQYGGVHPGRGLSNYFDGICVWAGADRTVISGNTITECGQAGVFAQAVSNLVVADNTVFGCILRGIEVDGLQAERWTDENGQPQVGMTRAVGVSITGNVVAKCHGHINLLNTSDATVVGNRIENPVADRPVVCIAINEGSNKAVVVGNYARQANPNRPAFFVHDTATDVTLAWNSFEAAMPYVAPAHTLIMQQSGPGQMTMTGSLKTTGKVIATGGLGVGNSATASTLGTVVRKMEVFTSTGVSLGWVPIYNSIS